MDKNELARILSEIALFLQFQSDNPFKAKAYRNASRAIESLEEDLNVLVEEDRIEEIPSIGKSIGKDIVTLVRTGHLGYYERLKKTIPQSVLELLLIPGLGAKKAKILYETLGIKSVDELTAACESGKVAELKGFGPRSQEKILSGIGHLQKFGFRLIWWQANNDAKPILEELSKLPFVQKVEIAGSMRRKLETIGDFDFVVASNTPEKVIEWFVQRPSVESILAQGPTKASVRLRLGPQADIRVVKKKEFPFALSYFTGSKEHTIELRKIANLIGFSLSEYKLSPLKKGLKVPFEIRSEEDLYKALGLSYIPPEMRENMGEIQAAMEGKIPQLIEESDIQGIFHCHTTESDGHNSLDEMAEAAENLGWKYLGISDHSRSSTIANGMSEERLFKQIEQIRRFNKKKKHSIHLFAGLECDLVKDGKLDFPDDILKELDFVIVSNHRFFKLDEETTTKWMIRAIENPYTTIIGHLTGRLLLRREPYAINIDKVVDAAIANNKIIEINSHPYRLDMDWRYWHKAQEKGLKTSINPDAHRIDELQYYKAGVNIARKGWLEKKDVLNTYPLDKVKAFLNKGKWIFD